MSAVLRTHVRGRLVSLLAALVLAPVVTVVQPAVTSADTGANPVLHWSAVAESAITAGRPPASSTVLAAMVHAAMYDAVAGVTGDLEPFATGVTAAPGASVDAAVAKAARDVLVTRVPGQSAAVQAAYDAFVAGIPAGAAKDAGLAAGAAAATGMLAARAGDGFDAVVPYVQATPGPGVFEPVALPGATPGTPVDTKLGGVRPFTYDSPADVRPDAPYPLTSKKYADDLDELVRMGGVTSERDGTQTSTVLFFSDNTFLQYSRALRDLVDEQGMDVVESARLLGYASVAVADSMIACFEAKYHFGFWRPVHAIARADTDGNPATSPVAGWASRLVVNHPEYPSGHGCYTAALTEALRGYFRTKHVPFTISSTTVNAGPARTYDRLDDLVDDVADARVWAGLHYRTTMEVSAKHYTQIARDIGKRYFLETAH